MFISGLAWSVATMLLCLLLKFIAKIAISLAEPKQ